MNVHQFSYFSLKERQLQKLWLVKAVYLWVLLPKSEAPTKIWEVYECISIFIWFPKSSHDSFPKLLKFPWTHNPTPGGVVKARQTGPKLHWSERLREENVVQRGGARLLERQLRLRRPVLPPTGGEIFFSGIVFFCPRFFFFPGHFFSGIFFCLGHDTSPSRWQAWYEDEVLISMSGAPASSINC